VSVIFSGHKDGGSECLPPLRGKVPDRADGGYHIDHYLVIGNPINHSLSPQIHTAFAKQTNQSLIYDRLCVEPENFIQTLTHFFTSGGKGANITAPFKTMAFDYVQSRCTERAKLAQAVNTLYINPKDNLIHGDNTDGIGLLRDLQKHSWTITGKKILILGAGGAVRGIISSLLSENPLSIEIYNRTPNKITPLIQTFQHLGPLSSFSHSSSYDLIINSIPSHQVNQAEYWSWLPSLITPDTHAYDLNYRPPITGHPQTPFLEKMKFYGCLALLDGLGMLIEQAAESFFIWRNILPKSVSLIYSQLKLSDNY
jgi:shikimate dehydrogenase